MNKRTIKEVKVKTKFPGYKVGDVLIKNSVSGMFEYAYNDADTNMAIGNAFKAITESNQSSLSYDDIVSNFDYFEDITKYEVKSPSEISDKIKEFSKYITDIKADDKAGLFLGSVNKPDVKEAITVWQNMIWLLEWTLGQRDNI